ncbi:33999_t:CDS:1, partial [Gigaspora margarita]
YLNSIKFKKDEYKVPVDNRSAPTLYNLFHCYQNETNIKEDKKKSKNRNIKQHKPADVDNGESRKVNMSTKVGHDEDSTKMIVFN